MCEANAFWVKDGKEAPVFEGVDRLEEHNGQVKLVNLYGEERIIKARVKSFSLVDHKIILEPLSD